MRFDFGTLDSGEWSLPFGLLVKESPQTFSPDVFSKKRKYEYRVTTESLDKDFTINLKYHMCATAWQNQQMTCAPSKLRSAWASTQSDQSSLCAQWVAKDTRFQTDSKDWSDWADAQADVSLHWAHRSFRWFCCVAAHILIACTIEVEVGILSGSEYGSRNPKINLDRSIHFLWSLG